MKPIKIKIKASKELDSRILAREIIGIIGNKIETIPKTPQDSNSDK